VIQLIGDREALFELQYQNIFGLLFEDVDDTISLLLLGNLTLSKTCYCCPVRRFRYSALIFI
jgi:hypothetical protein